MTANYGEADPLDVKIQRETECLSSLMMRISHTMELPYIDQKLSHEFLDEIRLMRCVFERLLRVLSEAEFVDYQREKFSGRFLDD